MEHRYSADERPPGLFSSAVAFLKSLSALLVSRAELAALELGELRDTLVKLLLVGAFGIVALLFALGCWTALLVVLGWPALGWKILLLVALFYTLLAAGLALHIKRLLAANKLTLPATMAELRKDRDTLL